VSLLEPQLALFEVLGRHLVTDQTRCQFKQFPIDSSTEVARHHTARRLHTHDDEWFGGMRS
jgi:hypothetical protein